MAITTDVTGYARSSRNAPQAVTDTQAAQLRSNRFGDQSLFNSFGRRELVEEGSYYKSVNATDGTGIASAASVSAFVTTTPYMSLKNNETAKKVYLDYIKLICATPSSSSTTLKAVLEMDTGRTAASGGTAMVMENASSSDTLAYSGVVGRVGAVTAGAAVANRTMGRHLLRSVIPVASDEIILDFSGGRHQSVSDMAGTTAKRLVVQCVPIILAPAYEFLLNLWGASASGAATYEFEVGFAVR